MRSRWITIGRIEVGRYIKRVNCGFPGGMRMYWHGRIRFAQSFDFLNWAELLTAVRHRVRQARLEPVAIACAAPRTLYGDILLLVEVRRRLTPYRPFLSDGFVL